jgi:hypothetical protein
MRGLGAHARDVINTQIPIATIPAAAGGMFKRRLEGNLAKPNPTMMLGRYQFKAYKDKFISVWSKRNPQVVGLLSATIAS